MNHTVRFERGGGGDPPIKSLVNSGTDTLILEPFSIYNSLKADYLFTG